MAGAEDGGSGGGPPEEPPRELEVYMHYDAQRHCWVLVPLAPAKGQRACNLLVEAPASEPPKGLQGRCILLDWRVLDPALDGDREPPYDVAEVLNHQKQKVASLSTTMAQLEALAEKVKQKQPEEGPKAPEDQNQVPKRAELVEMREKCEVLQKGAAEQNARIEMMQAEREQLVSQHQRDMDEAAEHLSRRFQAIVANRRGLQQWEASVCQELERRERQINEARMQCAARVTELAEEAKAQSAERLRLRDALENTAFMEEAQQHRERLRSLESALHHNEELVAEAVARGGEAEAALALCKGEHAAVSLELKGALETSAARAQAESSLAAAGTESRRELAEVQGRLGGAEWRLEAVETQFTEAKAEAEGRLTTVESQFTKAKAEAEGRLAAAEAQLGRAQAEAEGRLAAAEAQLGRAQAEAEGRLKRMQSQMLQECTERESRVEAVELQLTRARAEAEGLLERMEQQMARDRQDSRSRLEEAEGLLERTERRMARDREDSQSRLEEVEMRAAGDRSSGEGRVERMESQMLRERTEAESRASALSSQLRTELAEAEARLAHPKSTGSGAPDVHKEELEEAVAKGQEVEKALVSCRQEFAAVAEELRAAQTTSPARQEADGALAAASARIREELAAALASHRQADEALELSKEEHAALSEELRRECRAALAARDELLVSAKEEHVAVLAEHGSADWVVLDKEEAGAETSAKMESRSEEREHIGGILSRTLDADIKTGAEALLSCKEGGEQIATSHELQDEPMPSCAPDEAERDVAAGQAEKVKTTPRAVDPTNTDHVEALAQPALARNQEVPVSHSEPPADIPEHPPDIPLPQDGMVVAGGPVAPLEESTARGGAVFATAIDEAHKAAQQAAEAVEKAKEEAERELARERRRTARWKQIALENKTKDSEALAPTSGQDTAFSTAYKLMVDSFVAARAEADFAAEDLNLMRDSKRMCKLSKDASYKDSVLREQLARLHTALNAELGAAEPPQPPQSQGYELVDGSAPTREGLSSLDSVLQLAVRCLLALQGLGDAGESRCAELGAEKFALMMLQAVRLGNHAGRAQASFALASAGACCLVSSRALRRKQGDVQGVAQEARKVQQQLESVDGLKGHLKEKVSTTIQKLVDLCISGMKAWQLLETYLTSQRRFAKTRKDRRAGPNDLRLLLLSAFGDGLDMQAGPAVKDLAAAVWNSRRVAGAATGRSGPLFSPLAGSATAEGAPASAAAAAGPGAATASAPLSPPRQLKRRRSSPTR